MLVKTDELSILRKHLIDSLGGGESHMKFEEAVKDFPSEARGRRLPGSPHSAWELVEHLRIAQRDILDFVRDEGYTEPEWPADYWPGKEKEASAEDWHAEAQAFRDDLAALLALLNDPATDLLAVVPNGQHQTWLREFLLVADHNAYHVGQLVVLKRMLGGG